MQGGVQTARAAASAAKKDLEAAEAKLGTAEGEVTRLLAVVERKEAQLQDAWGKLEAKKDAAASIASLEQELQSARETGMHCVPLVALRLLFFSLLRCQRSGSFQPVCLCQCVCPLLRLHPRTCARVNLSAAEDTHMCPCQSVRC